MNFIQPSIDPVILSIGFIEIRWYSLAYILGFLLGIYIIKRLNLIYGNQYSNKNIDNFLIWAVLGVVIWVRTGYVIFYQFNEFLTNPFYLLKIWNGGMSFHGGLTGIIISTFIFAKIKGKSFFYLSDLVSIVAPIGLFVGRIATFINTELIGRPTDFYISIIYPSIDNIPRHPSQIYEAFLEGIILFIILLIYFYRIKKYKIYGAISGLFLIFYSIFRFLIEYVREPDLHLGLFLNFISMGQILCIPFFIFGILIIQNVKQNKN